MRPTADVSQYKRASDSVGVFGAPSSVCALSEDTSLHLRFRLPFFFFYERLLEIILLVIRSI